MKLAQILRSCFNYKILIGVLLLILLVFLLMPQSAHYSWVLLALICPTSMIFMMAKMQGSDKNSAQKIFICPACELSYHSEEWAKKCEVWCRKYNSCNLEITKHAIER